MINVNGLWLMDAGYFESMAEGYTRFEVEPEPFQAFIERVSARDAGPRFIMQDGIAHIPVMGPLTVEPEVFFSIFGGSGGTVFGDIVAAAREADADPEVSKVIFEIDSPGGSSAGFFETAKAIRNMTTPTEAHITDLGASAAFGLAAQTDRIVAQNPMALVGSVGVVTNRFVSENRVTIRSSAAPLKNPDAGTPEGVAAIQAELDAIHTEFVQVIADGRSKATGQTVTVETINSDFGRGAVVTGRDALAAGMVDAIADATATEGGGRAPAENPQASSTEKNTMDLEILKSQHPDIYAAVMALGRTDGHTAGVKEERDRVSAHVIAAKACGEQGTAIAMGFIDDGSDFSSQTVQATYMTARVNGSDITARNDDDNDAKTGPAATNAGEIEEPDEDANTMAIFAEVRENRGMAPINE
ncbi:MAG: S49 family peptidase [Planctomycetota bacterium]